MPDPLATLSSALADRYTIERELGRGGMATVYLATDVRQGRRVAIKVLHPDLSVALGVERFQREIAIASSLTHPHVVPLYESGDAGGSLYYVMPFIEGETLRTRLDREKQLPLEDAVRIACEVASALDYAHRHGVVHRDVKPANILLEDGHAVIADFGIARALSRATGEHTLTVTGVTLGTPSYMSPEQASAEREIDGRSDIYALGCVVYEMLAGTPPFTGPNPQAVMARHAMDTAPSIRVIRNIIPPEVEAAIFCAMAKAPADRFATAQQFADALTGNAGMGTTLRYTAKWAVARTRRKKFWTFAILTAMLIPMGAGGAYLALRDGGGTLADPNAFAANRIAVLYFRDASPDGSLVPVADGLTQALIDRLDRVQGLDVISTRGVEPFRGTTDLQGVGTELRAGSVVDGSIRSVGDSVHVSVSLHDGNSAVAVGRGSFYQPLATIVAAQDSLAEAVAQLLRERLNDQVRLQLDRAKATNTEAWVLVQRSRGLRKVADSLEHAHDLEAAQRQLALADTLLVRARSLDAEWATPLVARGALAEHRSWLEHSGRRVAELFDLGLALVDTALALDPANADAFEVRGRLRFLKVERGVAADRVEAENLLRMAEEDLREAVALNPQQAGALLLHSELLYRRYDRLGSATLAERAYEADAYLASAPQILWRLYATNYDFEQFSAADKHCRAGYRQFPEHWLFARCQLWHHTTPEVNPPDVEAAWRAAARLDSLAPASERESARREGQILVAAVIGRAARQPGADSAALLDSARAVLVRARTDRTVDPKGDLIGFEAAVRVMLGEHDEAIALLQRYLTISPTHREGFAKNSSWWWAPLNDDPRFKDLIGSGH